MIITGTRSYIIVEIDGKVMKIDGELTTTPIFYADINSIDHWEEPYNKVKLTKMQKTNLIERITKESNKVGNIKIVFN